MRVVRRARREAARPAAGRQRDREPPARAGARRDPAAGRGRTRRRRRAARRGPGCGVRGARDARRAERPGRGVGARRRRARARVPRRTRARRHGPDRARPLRALDGAGPRHGPGRGHLGADGRPRGGPAPPPAGRGRPDRARPRAVHGPRPPVHRLAVGRHRAGPARRHVGGVALPPRGGACGPARRVDDGHPRLDRRDRRDGVVVVGPAARWRRRARHADDAVAAAAPVRRARALPRGRGRRHDVPARRTVRRAPRAPPRGRRAARPARPRREGRRGAGHRGRPPHGAARADRAAAGR